MNHLTNLYKHKCVQLQEKIYRLTKMLNEADAPGPTQFPSEFQVPNQPQDKPFQVAPLYGEPGYEDPIFVPHVVPMKPQRQDYSSDAAYARALKDYEEFMRRWREGW